jgi:hypothetical protein
MGDLVREKKGRNFQKDGKEASPQRTAAWQLVLEQKDRRHQRDILESRGRGGGPPTLNRRKEL